MSRENLENVKKVLIQYKKVRWMIDDLTLQIEDITKEMSTVKAGKITGMPRGGVPITFADLIADKDDLERRKKKFEIIADQKKEIVQTYIDTVLSVKHNRLLTLYYVRCLSMREVAKKEHYTERHAFRVYSEALEMVDLSLDL